MAGSYNTVLAILLPRGEFRNFGYAFACDMKYILLNFFT
jgi:hypothetical protein